MSEVLFSLFGAVAVASALLAVTRKNAVAAASWLVVMFFGLAAVYVLLEAWFTAVAQVLVYAGAIMVLFLFVIMLLDLKEADLKATTGPHLKLAGVILSGAILAGLILAVRDASDGDAVADRVTATLREAPPGGEGAATETPLPLAGVAPEGPTAESVPGGRAAPGRGDRAWGGPFRLAAAPGAARRLAVTVAPGGGVVLTVDGVPQPAVRWDTPKDSPRERRASIAVPGAPAGTTIDLVLLRGGLGIAAGPAPDGSARGIGRALFEEWLLPFEVASLLLTGAVFGAVVLTKRRLA